MATSADDLDIEIRVRKWLDESQDLIGRVIPSLMEECQHLHHETVELQSYVAMLQEKVDRLQRERGASARAAEAHLTDIARFANEAIQSLRQLDTGNDADHQSSRARRDGAIRRRAAKSLNQARRRDSV